jgi:glycogen operon protein
LSYEAGFDITAQSRSFLLLMSVDDTGKEELF